MIVQIAKHGLENTIIRMNVSLCLRLLKVKV
jgi:hypothetical protein